MQISTDFNKLLNCLLATFLDGIVTVYQLN
jgi:hypothetical protein